MANSDEWFGVELRHLAALSAVAREGSFRGAADSLGYVQSSVSQRILQLERLVGVRLVDRNRGSKEIRMTPAGEALVGHAEDILWRVQSARADLASRSNGRSSVLRVGVTASVAGGLLERVLRALAARTPQLRVHPVESASDGTLLDLVEQGEADVAFADLPLPSGPFKSRTILRDPWILLASESSEWVERREPPTVEELAEAPLIMLEGARSTGHLEAWFRSHGVVSKPAARAASDTTLRAFVAAGLGVAVVPGLAAPAWDARTVAIDLEGLVPSRCLGICWHSGRAYGGALQAFCEVTSEVAHRGEGRPI